MSMDTIIETDKPATSELLDEQSQEISDIEGLRQFMDITVRAGEMDMFWHSYELMGIKLNHLLEQHREIHNRYLGRNRPVKKAA